jgi:hypothetical protein
MPSKRHSRGGRRVDPVERVDEMEVDITNQAELRANAHSILATIRQQRPENTQQVYAPKQREWKVGRDASLWTRPSSQPSSQPASQPAIQLANYASRNGVERGASATARP